MIARMIARTSAALFALALAACSSDAPKSAPPATDSGAALAAGTTPDDAGPPMPAPPDAGPPASAPVDAGAPVATTTTTPTEIRAESASKLGSVRVLAKPKDASLTKEDAQAAVEQATGAKVIEVRRSARTWFVLVFADGISADQAMAGTKDTGLFSSVELDRVMKVK